MAPISRFPGSISLTDFSYLLPDDRIARRPLPERDSSRLLIWRPGNIRESTYARIADFLPAKSVLVFNNSRVIEARILFTKPSGGQIEVFCLEPHTDYPDISVAMKQTEKVFWTCLIGGASKWKKGQVLSKELDGMLLTAHFVGKRKDDFTVGFSWTPATLTFSEVLEKLGSIPLPPYMKRAADINDQERYQTIYAKERGSVAAPTAGLHFSEKIIKNLYAKNIVPLYLTLHVGAGTFLPVKSETIGDHIMHEEFIEVSSSTVESLIALLDRPVIAVGTTSLRTLETLYWLGMLVSADQNIKQAELQIKQFYSYDEHPYLSAKESLTHLLYWINRQPDKKLVSKTQLFIVPGYSFKIVSGLVTNFHQPQSTLLLLVAALAGIEWKSVYQYALDNNFRFLSYGDGCLFLPGSESTVSGGYI